MRGGDVGLCEPLAALVSPARLSQQHGNNQGEFTVDHPETARLGRIWHPSASVIAHHHTHCTELLRKIVQQVHPE